MVETAIEAWESVTCVRFIKVLSFAEDTVQIIDGGGCYSNIGYAPSRRIISLSNECATLGGPSNLQIYMILSNLSEFSGHILGLIHEQCRRDRDGYVIIDFQAIIPEMRDAFSKRDRLIKYNLPYDLGSIMHYSSQAFSEQNYRTIHPFDENFYETMGQRDSIGFYDAAAINIAYCSNILDSCNNQLYCLNNGYTDPNDCSKCLCPSGFAGKYCNQAEGGDKCTNRIIIATSKWSLLLWNGTAN
ncbi:unnamed protein product [Dracunculus medinensis]|uniref:Metalloendopeptidase n=1 Tax=Dracunculus medinensis TaxID=318479 RepID=A0A0N4UAJ7_DRAME|nr:unnamed protein product [Dracunculus medinensis]